MVRMSKQHWIYIANMIVLFYLYIYIIYISLFSGFDPYRVFFILYIYISLFSGFDPYRVPCEPRKFKHMLIIQFTCLECLSSDPKVDPQKKRHHTFFLKGLRERSKLTGTKISIDRHHGLIFSSIVRGHPKSLVKELIHHTILGTTVDG